MLIKIINYTLGLALLAFVATAPAIPLNQTDANETFKRVAEELNATPAESADTQAPSTIDGEWQDGCLDLLENETW